MEKAGEDEEKYYSLIDSPQAFFDTPDSADSVRRGGLAEKTIETVSILSILHRQPDLQ